jgi:murein DD-endopeptidase MepM/ murein hydrolase activator NlpD
MKNLLIIILLICLSGFIISHYVLMGRLNIRERLLKSELDVLKDNYKLLNTNLDSFLYDLYTIQNNIDDIQNLIFSKKSETSYEWLSGIVYANEYVNEIVYDNNNNVSSGDLIDMAQLKVDKIKNKIEDQLCDLFYLDALLREREDKYESIPSIKPILYSNQGSLELLSGFGARMHPIHKIIRIHTGIDFPAPIGTEEVATGSGHVIKKGYMKGGYGKYLIIDHGYNYATLYAHLDNIKVSLGEYVKRYQVIGTVGNTGVSTSPHLHYEVRHNGNPVDPIDFCKDGLTDEEYGRLVKSAKMLNKTYD